MSTPQTQIFICSGVRLNKRQEHSIYFSDPASQLAYFSGKVVKTLTAYSYVRRDWDIKVEASPEEASLWTYLYFRNTTNGKTYFYFIESVEYVSGTTVRLKLTLDVIQTYLFDFELNPCFVERQHVESDAIGEHTVTENVEMGDYTIQGVRNLTNLYANSCVMIQATKKPGTVNKTYGGNLNGTYSGVGLYAVRIEDAEKLEEIMSIMETAGDIDAIINMWMYPRELIVLKSGQYWDTGEGDVHAAIKEVRGVKTIPYRDKLAKPGGIDLTYEPNNNKLLTYPFCYLGVSNNNGGSAVLKYERFDGDYCDFHVEGTLSPEGAVSLIPENYNGLEYNYEEALGLGGFPTCAWDADAYKIWLAQNRNTQDHAMQQANLSIIGGAVAGIASLATGNAIGAVGSLATMYHGYNQVQGIIASRMDRATEPPQARGRHTASVNFDNMMHTYIFYHKSITKENARVIDGFFDMYGYQLNEVRTPNINARKHYTYVKTQNCHITANICNEDCDAIEAIFNTGITFWKNGDKISAYSLASDNTPNLGK